jgi:hypothetical protein
LRYILLAVLLISMGCSGNEEREKPKAPAPNSASTATKTTGLNTGAKSDQSTTSKGAKAGVVDGQTAAKDQRPIPQLSRLTSAAFADEIKGVASCTGTTESELKKCDQYLRVLKILSDRDAPAKHRRFLKTSAGNRLLSDPSANVRWLSVRLLRSIAQVEDSSRQKLKARLEKEDEPLVLESLIRTLGLFLAEDASLKRRYMDLADHKSEVVRAASVRWLAHLNDTSDQSLAELLESKLKSDDSKAVGKSICLELALRPDDKGLPALLDVIRSTEHRANEPCFLALTSTWIAPSLPKMSVVGFDATVTELTRRLDNELKVPWSVMARLGQGGHLMTRSKLSEAQLVQLRNRLLATVHAQAQDIQVRVGAVQALKTYKAPPQTFNEIIETYDDATDFSYQLSARAKMYRVAPTRTP